MNFWKLFILDLGSLDVEPKIQNTKLDICFVFWNFTYNITFNEVFFDLASSKTKFKGREKNYMI